MTNQLRPLLALLPTVLTPHYLQRSFERGFQAEWLSILWQGNWRPDPGHPDRFLIEGEVAPSDWWRLVVVLAAESSVIVILTVYPISTAQVVA